MKVFYIFVFLFIILNIIQLSGSSGSEDYCEILKYSLLFYKAQRAGKLPDNDIPWRSDSVMNDSYGSTNLANGYFDAGDGVKFGFPMAYTMTMLGWIYIQHESNIVNCGVDGLYKDILKWGIDYNIAAHVEDDVFVAQIAKGTVDHGVWCPPEDITYERDVFTIDSSNPGTDILMEAAASLAAASIVFKGDDESYSSECLTHAKSLYDLAMKSDKKEYSKSISDASIFYDSSGYLDEIAWASAWLYKATETDTYLNTSIEYYNNDPVQYSNQLSWDNKGVSTGLLLYQINQGETYKTNIENALKYWQTDGGIKYTPGGLAYLNEWGPCRHSMSMSLIAAMFGGDYTSFAQGQLDYVLGKNPNSISYVVGWGNKYPLNPHHRAAHHSTEHDISIPAQNTYTLYGALVGGPSSDDSYKDDRSDYIQSEVALDYNVGLVGTLAALSSDSSPATDTNPYSNSASTNNNSTTSTK